MKFLDHPNIGNNYYFIDIWYKLGCSMNNSMHTQYYEVSSELNYNLIV